jgi:septal ring factor EnvC (AmiA/AmiB activator)
MALNAVSEAGEYMTPREVRSTDISSLKFPIQIVIAIVAGFLAAAGAFYTSQAGLRSDVRDILTRLDFQVKAQDDRINDVKHELEKTKDQLETTRLELANLQKTFYQSASRR